MTSLVTNGDLSHVDSCKPIERPCSTTSVQSIPYYIHTRPLRASTYITTKKTQEVRQKSVNSRANANDSSTDSSESTLGSESETSSSESDSSFSSDTSQDDSRFSDRVEMAHGGVESRFGSMQGKSNADSSLSERVHDISSTERNVEVVSDAGKPHKLAITALMRKLIILANTLIKQNRPWTPKPA